MDTIKEDSQLILKDALSLMYEVAESNKTEYVQSALIMIASLQIKMENYEESEKALKKIAMPSIDPSTLYAVIYQKQGKTEEAKRLSQNLLLQSLNSCTSLLSRLVSISMEENENEASILYLNALNQIEETFNVGTPSASISYCKFYIKTDQKELAATWFQRYAKEMLTSDYNYSKSPYFNSVKIAMEKEWQTAVWKKLYQEIIENEEFKCLSGIPEYEKGIEALKKGIGKEEEQTCGKS